MSKLFPAKLYSVQVRSASIALEQVPPALVVDWLTLHAERCADMIVRHGADPVSVAYRDELLRAADTVRRHFVVKV